MLIYCQKKYFYYKCIVYDFTGRELIGQFLRMLNEVLDVEIKKFGEDEVIKGYLKYFFDYEFLFMFYG